MNNFKPVILCLSGIAIMLTSCNKNEGLNSGNGHVNYDALYVVNGAGNSISVINLSTNEVQKTIDLGALTPVTGNNIMGGDGSNNMMWPYHISLSPDKSKLAISEPGMDFSGSYDMMQVISTSGSSTDIHTQHHNGTANVMQMEGKILILDAITGDLLKELTLEGMPHNAIFSTDGKEIWTAIMMPEGKIIVFDADSYNLLTTISVGNMPSGITFSDDGKKAFVANAMSGSVTVIDAVKKLVAETIFSGQEPVGVWPGMNSMMYVDNEKDQTISVINTMNNMMTDSIKTGFTPGMVIRNTIMNQMWVSDPAAAKIHFWTQTVTGFTYGGSVSVGKGAGAIIFSQTGNTGYVTNQEENTVSVIDLTGLKELLKIPVGKKPNSLIIRYK
ncbi:MAG: hypothetical protein WC854_02195 [Bacteroidales bacterium]